jgi:hypothetical protein
MKTKIPGLPGLGRCAAIVLLLGLGACSGGSDIAPTVSGTDVPVDATTDATAALVFVKSIVQAGDKDLNEPIQVGNVSLAEVENQEPDESI